MNLPVTDFYGQELTMLLGADHGGYDIKNELCASLAERGIEVVDVGPHCMDPTDDYTDFAGQLAARLTAGDANCGILLCRSGLGMSINANRFPLVRAALVSDPESARKSRSHNCSNVLVIGADSLELTRILKIVDAWLSTPFSGEERHSRRLAAIETNSRNHMAETWHIDSELAALVTRDLQRSMNALNLTASNNVASIAVRRVLGSPLTDRYANGNIGKRHYFGCDVIDDIERLAEARAAELFSAEVANLQPHSGTQANLVAFRALMQDGDTILALDPRAGGHPSYGAMAVAADRYNFCHFGLTPAGDVDYEQAAELAETEKPTLIVAGGSCCPRAVDFARFREIADEIGAMLMADMAHIAGLVAAGIHASPVPLADVVTSSTHKTLNGARGGMILTKASYTDTVRAANAAILGSPHIHAIAANAVALHEAGQPEFAARQRQVVANAKALATALSSHDFDIVTGGTDTHMVIFEAGAAAKDAAVSLDACGIITNDIELQGVENGAVRLGTSELTARGMMERDMETVAGLIADTLCGSNTREAVSALARQFPIE